MIKSSFSSNIEINFHDKTSLNNKKNKTQQNKIQKKPVWKLLSMTATPPHNRYSVGSPTNPEPSVWKKMISSTNKKNNKTKTQPHNRSSDQIFLNIEINFQHKILLNNNNKTKDKRNVCLEIVVYDSNNSTQQILGRISLFSPNKNVVLEKNI